MEQINGVSFAAAVSQLTGANQQKGRARPVSNRALPSEAMPFHSRCEAKDAGNESVSYGVNTPYDNPQALCLILADPRILGKGGLQFAGSS
jgi:hypothetical protein